METSTALKSLAALSHANRLAIFRLLVEAGSDGLAAGDIAERLGLPGATASFHLKELVNAELAAAHPRSRFVYYRADYGTMNALLAYLTENCCAGACATGRAPAPTLRRSPGRAKVAQSNAPRSRRAPNPPRRKDT